MLIKTSDLISSALDWAVSLITNPDWGHDDRLINVQGYDEDTYQPSIEWAQGGPIIERERMEIMPTTMASADSKYAWEARKFISECELFAKYGPTLLIAAMRCFVASKLGDEIEVPDELT